MPLLVKGFNKRRVGYLERAKADLWGEFWNWYSQLRCRFSIRRIFRSHVEPVHLALGFISPEEMGGNELADAFAEKGAALHQLSEDQVRNAKALDRRTGVWQQWLLAVTRRCCDVVTHQPKKFQVGTKLVWGIVCNQPFPQTPAETLRHRRRQHQQTSNRDNRASETRWLTRLTSLTPFSGTA